MNTSHFVSVVRSLALLSATTGSVMACSNAQTTSEGTTTTAASSGNGAQTTTTTTTATTQPNTTASTGTVTTTTTTQPVTTTGSGQATTTTTAANNNCEGLDDKTGCRLNDRCEHHEPFGGVVCVCQSTSGGGTAWSCAHEVRRVMGPLPPPDLAA